MTIAKLRELPWRSLGAKERSILICLANESLVDSQDVEDWVEYLCQEISRKLNVSMEQVKNLVKTENQVFFNRMSSVMATNNWSISINHPVFDLFQLPDYEQAEVPKDFFEKVSDFLKVARKNKTVKKVALTYLLLSIFSVVVFVSFSAFFNIGVKDPERFAKAWAIFGMLITIVGVAAGIIGIFYYIYKMVSYVNRILDEDEYVKKHCDDSWNDEELEECYEDSWDDQDLEEMNNPSRDIPYKETREKELV